MLPRWRSREFFYVIITKLKPKCYGCIYMFKRIAFIIASTLGLTRKIPRRGIDAFIKKHATSEKTLDIGSGHGPYGQYFPNRVSIDRESGPGVDLVADAHDLSLFPDETFECILATEVLEHLHSPHQAVVEMHRVLKEGGKVVLTTRFIFPLHNIPGDYFRFTRYGLAHLFSGFSKVTIEEEATTIQTFAVLFERLGFQTDTLHSRILSGAWLVLAKVVYCCSFLITVEYGEVERKNNTSHLLTSGYYVVAIK